VSNNCDFQENEVNRTSLSRIAAPSIAVLALGFAVTACGAGNESGGSGSGSSSLSGTLEGNGSSAQEAAQTAWRAGFQKTNAQVTVNYSSTDSGTGVSKFNGGDIDFAGSDSPLDPTKGEVDAAKKRCGANALEVPAYVSPIAVVFNLDGVKDLKLDAKTVADIFANKVTKWNDPEIASLNSGAKLPSSRISPVHRSDPSGTTKNFTDYLSKAADGAWAKPADKVWPFSTGEAANGTSGVVSSVTNGAGSIGYVDASQAGKLSKASIKVGSAFTAPSADGAAKALAASPVDKTRTTGDLAINVDRTTTAAGAYPLMLTSYVIACPTYSGAKADLVKKYLSYVVSTQGQQDASTNAGSAPLPSDLQSKAASIISTIKKK
jgi:phosphate transport system substrate-binding protein